MLHLYTGNPAPATQEIKYSIHYSSFFRKSLTLPSFPLYSLEKDGITLSLSLVKLKYVRLFSFLGFGNVFILHTLPVSQSLPSFCDIHSVIRDTGEVYDWVGHYG